MLSSGEWGSELSQFLVPGSLTLARLWIPIPVGLQNARNFVMNCARLHQREMQVGCVSILRQRELAVMLSTSPEEQLPAPQAHSLTHSPSSVILPFKKPSLVNLKAPPLRSFLFPPSLPCPPPWEHPRTLTCAPSCLSPLAWGDLIQAVLNSFCMPEPSTSGLQPQLSPSS